VDVALAVAVALGVGVSVPLLTNNVNSFENVLSTPDAS
jgi:hypothetical protein